MKINNINNNKPEYWKNDINLSVDFYNKWFLQFAPTAYREARKKAIANVDSMLLATNCLQTITPAILIGNPRILSILRMVTAPPIARDRLIGLAKVSSNFVKKVEEGIIPPRLCNTDVLKNFQSICDTISQLLDVDIFQWLNNHSQPDEIARLRVASIIADRVCGAVADPIIRNSQEKRQLNTIKNYLMNLGYQFVEHADYKAMISGTFSFHVGIPVNLSKNQTVNIPMDVVIQRKNSIKTTFPILIECKSAGDFTNTNKRRKEEAVKIMQLRNTYGKNTEFYLFLCGYFDSGYLGYEAAEGIDWIWEHRIEDLLQIGL